MPYCTSSTVRTVYIYCNVRSVLLCSALGSTTCTSRSHHSGIDHFATRLRQTLLTHCALKSETRPSADTPLSTPCSGATRQQRTPSTSGYFSTVTSLSGSRALLSSTGSNRVQAHRGLWNSSAEQRRLSKAVLNFFCSFLSRAASPTYHPCHSDSGRCTASAILSNPGNIVPICSLKYSSEGHRLAARPLCKQHPFFGGLCFERTASRS